MMKPFKAFHPFKLGVIMKAIGSWLPTRLFSDPLTNGVWYDPSDFTTLFQDAAGTTPVTAVEQPVGLMLDKSKNGVGTNGAKRVNLLTKTEDISASDWAAYTIASRTATKFIPDTVGSEHYIANSTSKTASAIQYAARFDVKDEGYAFSPIVVGDWNGASASNGWYFCINLSDGSYSSPVTFGSGWSVGTVAITRDSTTGICTVSLVFTTSAVSTRVGIGIYAYPSLKATSPFSFVGNGTSGIYCSKIDLRLASEAATLPTYQKITDTWYSTLPGNHAFNSSGNSANFPVLSARYNLLTKTEQFDDDVWKLFASTAKSGTTVCSLTFPTNSGSAIYAETIGTNAVSQTYTIRVMARAITAGKKIRLGIYTGVGNIESPDISLTSDFSEYTFTTPATTLTGVPSWFVKNDTAGTAGTIEFKQPSFCSSSDALNQPAYQRVNTATDYDTVGFKPYLSFNGVNQWLQTNSIDFTYGDKMFVCAGVRKLSDAVLGMLAELSVNAINNGGTFYISAPNGGVANYAFVVSGSSGFEWYTPATYTAPISNVLACSYDIAGTTISTTIYPRINGVLTQVAPQTYGTATGNFGNYPLYIGARAGTSLWANIRFYGAVVAGKQASADEITNTETFINQRTGAF